MTEPASQVCDPDGRACRDGAVRLLCAGATGLALGAIGATLCGIVAGATLGVFLGGLAVGAILAPGLVLSEKELWPRLFIVAGVADGIALVWLWATIHADLSLMKWLGCYAVLTALVMAMASLALVLRRLRLPAALAAGIVVFVGLGWLAWPIWLTPWLAGESSASFVGRLVTLSPAMAINGLLNDYFQDWASYPTIYHLTPLGRDVSYSLPAWWPAVVAHLAVTAGLLLPLRRRGPKVL